jgi:transposase
MLVANGNGLPIGLELMSANHHEVKPAVSTLEIVRVPRRGAGKPKQRPKEPVADKAYASKGFRNWLHSRRIRPTILSYKRRPMKRPKRGRLMKAGPGYAECWKVERTFGRLGNFRRLLVRYERCLSTFRAFFFIAFILVSLKRLP